MPGGLARGRQGGFRSRALAIARRGEGLLVSSGTPEISRTSLPDSCVQVAALKALGLNIKRAKLRGHKHKFYITDAATSEKIVKSSRLEEIRLTILNNMLRVRRRGPRSGVGEGVGRWEGFRRAKGSGGGRRKRLRVQGEGIGGGREEDIRPACACPAL